MNLSPESRVGEIAAQYPVATRSLHKFGIDFCCGGGIPLAEACKRKNVDPDELLDAIRTDIADAGESDRESWTNRSPSELVDHIVSEYHDPLREELPRLEGMLRKVVRVHGHYDPDRLGELLEIFVEMKKELDEHMVKEESNLFPGIVAFSDSATSAVPNDLLDSLTHEHESAGRALERIRALTDDFQPPEFACNTWRGLWAGLEELEKSMHRHVHLENHVLFPAVAAG